MNNKDAAYGDYRYYAFYDTMGKELAEWKTPKGEGKRSVVRIHHSSMPVTAPGGEVTVPDGHEIVGFAVVTDPEGYITWIDLKTWKPTRKM